MDKLRADTGAQIDVPSANDAPDASGRVQIRIKGTKQQVAEAKKILTQRASEFDATVTKSIEVDKKYHKALIGGGGTLSPYPSNSPVSSLLTATRCQHPQDRR
jgi:hypothetical protein